MEQQLQPFLALAFDRWTLVTAAGIYLLMRVLAQTPVARWGLYARAQPILPDALGVGAAFLGGIPAVVEQGLVVQAAAGLWCGYLAQRFHKVLGQTVLGDDRRVVAPPPSGPSSEEGEPKP